MAGAASLEVANLHFGFVTEDGGLEVHGQIKAQIVAALLAGGAASAAAHGKHLAEEVAKMSPMSTPPANGPRILAGRADSGMAVAVVCGALVGVAQHLIGLAGLLEALLAAWSPGLRSGWCSRAILR